MFDVYSLTHLFWAGLLMWGMSQTLGYTFSNAVIVAVITAVFEIHENMEQQIKNYRRIEIDQSGQTTYRGDSTINIIGDILFNLVGIYIAFYIRNPIHIALILSGTFGIITHTVGLDYWIEFFKFLAVPINIF